MNEKNKRWTMLALFLGLLEILFIDAMSSIVGPGIVAELGSTDLYAFMYTLTFLCNTLALPITSMLGNKSGRKYIIVAGVLVYGVSSLLAGLAGSMMFHVVMRGVQGIGKGCILGNVLAFFGESLDEQGRAKAMGFYGTLTGVVFVVAPLAGGAIGDLLGWRLTFYLSVPLTAVVLAVLLLKMPNLRPKDPAGGLDWAGTLLLSVLTIAIVMFFSWGGQTYSWVSVQVLGSLAVFLVSLVLFVRHINRCEHPVLSPALFRNREFVLVILGVVLIGPTLYAVGSYLPMLFQALAGMNATMSGAITALKSVVQLALGYAVGAFIGKTGRIKLVLVTTSVVYAASNFLMGLTRSPADMVWLILGVLLSGLGTTTYSMVYTLHAQNELPESLVGEGTSAIQFLQSMSGTIGLSIAGMVLNTSFARGLTGVVPEGLDAFLSAEELNGYMGTTLLTDPTAVEKAMAGLSEQGQTLFTQFVENLRSAYAGAMFNTFCVLGVLAAITLVFSLMARSSRQAAKN